MMLQEPDVHELLSKKEDELNKTKATLEGIREERDLLRRKVHKLLEELTWWRERDEVKRSGNAETEQLSSPVAKKAERVKLKKLQPTKSSKSEPTTNPLAGVKLDPEKVSSPLADHLIASLFETSTTQEILHSPRCADATDEDNSKQEMIQTFELEFGRFSSHYQRLKAERHLLRLTLQEMKAKMEQFQLLLMKYESNNAAYEQALFYCEFIAEAYDAFVGLLEEKILCPEILQNLSTNEGKSWTHLQNVLNGLISLVDSEYCTPKTCSIDSYLRDLARHREYDRNITPSSLLGLPKLVRRLAERKNTVRKSIVQMGAILQEYDSPSNAPRHNYNDLQYNIENAVLLLELSTVKEELHKLKCQYMSAYDDKLDLSTGWNSDVESDDELDGEKGKHSAYLSLADLRIGTMTESEIGTELSEALKREEKLKKENEKLGFMLQQVQHNSETRHRKSMEVMMSLRNHYSTLLKNSRKEKVKHTEKVDKLHEQLDVLSADQLQDMKSLKRQMKAYGRKKGGASHAVNVNETEL